MDKRCVLSGAPKVRVSLSLVTFIVVESGELLHSPPQPRMPHSEHQQHVPLDKGRHAIMVVATSSSPAEFGTAISYPSYQQVYIQRRWQK
jgi:hypothetical protein